jgi:hypothetical protein
VAGAAVATGAASTGVMTVVCGVGITLTVTPGETAAGLPSGTAATGVAIAGAALAAAAAAVATGAAGNGTEPLPTRLALASCGE